MKRASGILMHISSLPGPYGIGDFGAETYNFVDFLAAAGQKKWQILPLGITGFGDSPYQSFSAFAGNPYFIDLDHMCIQGYLQAAELKNIYFSREEEKVDYGLLYSAKMKALRLAFSRGKEELRRELENYLGENANWLRNFALFMALKNKNANRSWLHWPEELRRAQSAAVADFARDNQEELYFWVFTQYYFAKQWRELKDYANKQGISIIGDLPIYVSEDSADVWGNPELFHLDENLHPLTVSGCPPDAFSKTGQLWGNPISDWQVMEAQGYKWWVNRIRHSFTLFDSLRIDHFRGFESYWEVKYGAKTAEKGQWTKGPGSKLFNKIKEELGDLDIIAEDLGFITPEVRQLMAATGFPGMKVLQFAFDTREESDYLPHNYDKNCVVYTGTHDNHTIMGWFEHAPKGDVEHAINYLKLTQEEGYNWGFIRGAWSATAYLALAPLQDFLGLGDEARMNIPSTIGGNWSWRVRKEDLTADLAEKIYTLTKLYGR